MKLHNGLIARIAAAAMVASLAVPAFAQDAETQAPAVAATTAAAPAAVSNWSVQLDPHLPLPLIIGGALLLLGVAGASRNVRGAFLKAGAGTAVVATLLNPQIVREDRAPSVTEVAIVIDKSASQSIDGRDAATAEAHEALMRRLTGIPGVNVRTIETGRPQDANGNDGTHIFGTVAEGLADVSPDRLGAVFVLTDGQVHDAGDSAKAVPPGVPVHALVSGKENERDRRVILEQAPSYGLVNGEQTVTFRVVDDGATGTGPVKVDIAVDGKPLESRMAIPGESTTVTFTLEHGGANIVTIEAAPLEDELTVVNNRVATDIKGVRERMTVLLVSGEPTASERSWRSLLKSDPDLDLVHFTILRHPYAQDATPTSELSLVAFPTRELFEDRIKDFDLVIFDHYQPSANPQQDTIAPYYLDMIAEYVDGGGALLVMSGANAAQAQGLHTTPLGRILPAVPTGQLIEQPYRADISAMGARHPVTRDMPGADAEVPAWGHWYRQVDATVMPQGVVVMEGAQEKPLVVLSRQSEGRVGMILSDDAWMWARGIDGGGPYAAVMKRMAHWLMAEPSLEEEALRVQVKDGELTVRRQTMEDGAEPVTITTPSGTEQEVTLTESAPGVWTATIPAEEQGLYFATQGEHNAVTSAGPVSPREFTDARSTMEIMTPVAEASGGAASRMGVAGSVSIPRVTPVYNAEAALSGKDWTGVRMSAASELLGTDRYSPLSGWPALLLIMGLIAGAYWREGEKAGRRLADAAGKMWGRGNGPTPS